MGRRGWLLPPAKGKRERGTAPHAETASAPPRVRTYAKEARNVDNARRAKAGVPLPKKKPGPAGLGKPVYVFDHPAGHPVFVVFRYVPMYGIQLAFKTFRASLGLPEALVRLGELRIPLFEQGLLVLRPQHPAHQLPTRWPFASPFPVLLALLLNEIRAERYKKFVQTVYTFPHFLSWVLISGIVMNILSSTGVVNNIIVACGGEKYQFLTDKSLFRSILVFFLAWKESGWNCILYLASITAIDPSLYEAATIDGANRWHRMVYITWPGISMIVVVTLILRIGSMMDVGFDQVINMYNASVYDVGDIIDTYIYRITFQRAGNFGVSTAVGLFKGVTNCILLLSANWHLQAAGRRGHRVAGRRNVAL